MPGTCPVPKPTGSQGGAVDWVESRKLKFTFTVEGDQVQNLLGMTPHVYRIGKEGADRLRQTQTLTDTASCVLNLYIPE